MGKRRENCLVGLHMDTGMPLFVCNQNDRIPEVVLISLNSVQSFCQSFSINLVKTYAGDQVVMWNSFNGNIMLILLLNECHYLGDKEGPGMVGEDDDWWYRRVFSLLQRCIRFRVGRDQLGAPYEVLKQALEASLELLESVLEGLSGGASSPASLALLSLSDSISCSPQHGPLQAKFEEFTNAGKSKLSAACLFIGGRRAAATKKYTHIPPDVTSLIQYYVCETIHDISSKSSASKCSENVVYLPDSLQSDVLRLVTIELLGNVLLCVICPPKPALSEIISRSEDFWLSHLEMLQDMAKLVHQPLPRSIAYNQHLISYMVVSRLKRTSLVCCDVKSESTQQDRTKAGLLVNFFRDSNNNFHNNNLLAINSTMDVDMEIAASTTCSVVASYASSGDHKFFCSSDYGDLDVWLILGHSVPIYALKSVSKDFVDSLRDIKWIDF